MNTLIKQVWIPLKRCHSWRPCVDKAVFREHVKALVPPDYWDEPRFERIFFSFLNGRCSISTEEYERFVREVAQDMCLPF